MADTAPSSNEPIRPGSYGDRVVAIEPGGIEYIPAAERHGRASQMLWTWIAPNLEFATVFIGVLAVGIFGLPFWQAVAALTIGTALGAVAHGILSARGPRHGVPQMVLGRAAFGYWGNLLPSGLMAVTAGIGWFAVNSVSGAFALSALTGLPALASLVLIVLIQIAVTFFGHNLVHVFERYAVVFLGIVFAISSAVLLARTNPSAPTHPMPGSFLLTVGAAFGYAAGWNPYAADYTRYLPENTSPRAVGCFAGLGLFIACMVLEIAGAASVTAGGTSETNPVGAFTGQLPGVLSHLTLLAVAVGAVAANVLNTYSGAMAFLTMGIKLPMTMRRALVAIVFGAIGFLVAWPALADAGTKYTNFLLIIAYWIGPWLGVYLTDQWLRRGRRVDALLYDAQYRNWAGPASMATGMVVSIVLFCNQELFVGFVARHFPAIGDVAFLVGFIISAGLYAGLQTRRRDSAGR